MNGPIVEAAETLRAEQRIPVEVEDRTIRVLEEAPGDPGLVVLRVLGAAQAAPLVGAAAKGAAAVAAGVWRSPELYVVRWLNGRRWIVGYRLTTASRISDYVRTEGHVPSRLETGHWYDSAPDEVSEAFFEAGILLDEPPFPVPAPPPRPAKAANSSSRAPRDWNTAPRPSRSAALKPKAVSARVCPSCRMQKAEPQFTAGSDLCVDCR